MTTTIDGSATRPGIQHRSSLRWLVVIIASAAVLVSVVAATFIGTAGISFPDVVTTLAHHIGLGPATLSPLQDAIIWQLRASRVVEAAVVGGALAVCGCVLQAITRNALAEPYLLGTSSGASAGAIVVFLLGVGGGSISVAGGAFFGACASFIVVLLLLGRRGFDSTRIVLIGVVVGQFFSAIGSFVLMAAGDADSVYGITHWLLGELSAVRWDSALTTLVVCAIGMIIAWTQSTAMDALAFGTDTAASLGIPVRRTQIILLTVTAAMVGTIVASVGAIGFVGLIIPHAVRFIAGPAHRWLLPLSALVGAIFLIWADTLARTAFAPQEIPVGVFTALLGAPLFLVIMKRQGRL
jgi:iron complex transport system permease protein